MACGRNRSLLRDFAGTHLPGSDRNGDISTLHHLVPLETSGGGGDGKRICLRLTYFMKCCVFSYFCQLCASMILVEP